MGKDNLEVRFSRMNWDVECMVDLETENGFIISEPPEISLDGSKHKTMYGPQSPLYGTFYEDENAFMERYRCECGAFTSRQFEGETCPVCGTKVEYKGTNLSMTGWISLGENRIINPYYYNILKSAIGKSVFPDIVTGKHRVDKDGNRKELTEDDFESKPSSPYMGIGIDKFYDDYENILTYFKSVKKNKANVLDTLIQEKAFVFTSHIPVYSTMLRPQSVTADTFYYGKMDTLINTTYSLSESIKNAEEIERDLILHRLQTKVNQMWEINFELINGKEGFIRGENLGGSLNYTSRNVIIPDPSLRLNQVDISYQTFRELFKQKIIYYIKKVRGCHFSKAYDIWKSSIKYNEEVYQVMKHILKTEKVKLLINRNPTLNYYSLLSMQIRNIKVDDTDFTLSLNLSILPGLNADFDGDILNIIALGDKSLVYMFRKFEPDNRMVIDRDSGKLNGLFDVTKSQRIVLYDLWTCGALECDQLET